MKKIMILLLVLFQVMLAMAQEEPAFPVDNLLKGREKQPLANAVLQETFDQQSLDSVVIITTSQVNNDSIQSYMQRLEDFGTRFMLAANHRDVAEWIRQKFISFGYQNARLDSFECVVEWPVNSGTLDTSWQYNILATLDGSMTPQINCIIGGHYDAIIYSGGDPYVTAPGADDNASAIAATLEVARILKSTGFVPKTSLTFAAWAGEERGLLGSIHHVIQALDDNTPVKAYLNNDMISYYADTVNFIFNVNQYSGSRWLGDYARMAAMNCTLLLPDTNTTNSQGSDSYAFYLGGFPSLYFSSDDFTPNYHTPADLVSSCNIPYCGEITKVTMGTLMIVDQSPSPVKLDIFNPGTGNSLIPRWKPNPENDIAYYQVRMGTAANTFYQTYFTTDTSLTATNLSSDSVYYFNVSAMNNDSLIGPASLVSDKPVLVTMNQGILIVDDSEGGILNPADSVVDAFYRETLSSFSFTEYDAYMEQKIDLAELGKYSSVLWHINKQTSITVLNRYLPEVVKYLRLGGNILFSLYQPERAIFKLSYYPITWSEGNFIYDYLNIQTHDLQVASYFNTAVPYNTAFPLLETDSAKTQSNSNYHLPNIEAIYPNNQGSVIYTYGTAYDTATPQGGMAGEPVSVMSGNAPWKTVTLSFPLYYMQAAEAKTFVEKVMNQYFGESPIGMQEPRVILPALSIRPNPASRHATLQFTCNGKDPVTIQVFTILGEELANLVSGFYSKGTHRIDLDVSSYIPGIYLVRMKNGPGWETQKFVVGQK